MLCILILNFNLVLFEKTNVFRNSWILAFPNNVIIALTKTKFCVIFSISDFSIINAFLHIMPFIPSMLVFHFFIIHVPKTILQLWTCLMSIISLLIIRHLFDNRSIHTLLRSCENLGIPSCFINWVENETYISRIFRFHYRPLHTVDI